MASALDRLAYGATQGLRVSWYYGQKLVAAARAEPQPEPREPPRPKQPRDRGRRRPDRARLLRDLARLLERDWQNIAAGYYQLPADLVPNPLPRLRRSRQFFADLPRVEARRLAGDNSEVFRQVPKGRYPRYYLQNFHYQTDGYLSRQSAELYDHQVEVLFGGAADAMRRQALVPLHDEILRRGVRETRLIDLACGTGRFLREVKNNYPRLHVTGLDLSPFYLDEARRSLADWSRTEFLAAPAEAVPSAPASFEIVTSIYLFHELPAKQRRAVAQEIARILKPGGLFIFLDSLQCGDEPDYEILIERFPQQFHEPYYANYAREDLKSLFGAAGLAPEESRLAYFSKLMTFRKPEEPAAPG
ncbi:MAG: class I SAM-dependent methyltransferase [Alphaproteobacteria bacterium]|nr:class I SAM-dependent methyltransferase [Alphaproteobacteria bacterium]